jgi:hypothetical protein
VDESEDVEDKGWANLPRRYVAWAILGWAALAALAYGVALIAGWTALTDGKALILILVGAPYWLALIFWFNRLETRRAGSDRS